MIMKWKKCPRPEKGVCVAQIFLPRKYGGAADFGCLQHSGSFKPGGGNGKLYACSGKGRNAGIARFFLADNLGATCAFTAGNIYALWKFWTQEGLPVSEYSVLVLSIANLNAKLVRLGTEYARFTENLLYVEDFLNFFAEEKPAQKDETQEEALQSVEAKQLSFTYPNGTAGLHDISFLAKKGERVVMVGENGAGKSTFLKVLLGLYPDFTGKLYRNGAVSRTGIGKNVFALLQDYRLYPATVAENVLLRECRKRGRNDCVGSAAESRSGRKIECLPQGIHTAVELFEEGEKAMFSAGEGQRLALCRVFAGDFDAVILDEPTAF